MNVYKSRFPKSRRGLGLVEMTVTSSLFLGVLTLVASSSRLVGSVYNQRDTEILSSRSAVRVLRNLERDLRETYQVVRAEPSLLEVKLVARSDGRIALPARGGETVIYYLGDEERRVAADGGIVWRKDESSTTRVHELAQVSRGGLAFSYFPSASRPESIRVRVSLASEAPVDNKQGAGAQATPLNDKVYIQETLLRNLAD